MRHFATESGKSKGQLDLAIYWQERDNATYAPARMNAILHGCPTAERYVTPLPSLVQEVDALAARVDGHLKRMGFSA